MVSDCDPHQDEVRSPGRLAQGGAKSCPASGSGWVVGGQSARAPSLIGLRRPTPIPLLEHALPVPWLQPVRIAQTRRSFARSPTNHRHRLLALPGPEANENLWSEDQAIGRNGDHRKRARREMVVVTDPNMHAMHRWNSHQASVAELTGRLVASEVRFTARPNGMGIGKPGRSVRRYAEYHTRHGTSILTVNTVFPYRREPPRT
ncbi:hypothetical protein N7510_011345 [Penicillium lagena]|uniref:uncharacterized protein n=1 Tax=Penicillium lagena TaxID=94218 RepID=UPI0025412CED|nr:uncharacterized protein N7510_011345 [Penicillium lagena]KAJ5601811.1 hypothetical protein N7510_011345 [Penicillium lagena]